MKAFLSFFLALSLLVLSRTAAANPEISLKAEMESLATQYQSEEVEFGVFIQDLNSGQVVYSKNADLLLNPASNTKILTSLASLSLLGGDYTFKTQLLGAPGEEKGTLKLLALKGYGDPFFSTERLQEMVKELKAQGIRRVRDVGVDGSYFDSEEFPGQMEGRQRDASFNCNVGAVSIDHNLLDITVTPAEKIGGSAKVEALPPLSSFPIKGNVVTSKKRGRVVVKNDPKTEDDLTVSVTGTITFRSGPQDFRVSVHHPLQLAGLRLIEALKGQGIQAPEKLLPGCIKSKDPVLMESKSPPLAEILQEMNKNSDNFIAEQLTKTLAAQFAGPPGNTQKGVQVILKRLKELGVRTDGVELENGSGLSKIGRLRAETLAQVLRKAYDDPKIRASFLPSLSVMGVDGTLRRRFRNSDLAGRFLGKTGTLSGVSSLSGYIFPKNSEKPHPYIFSFIINGRGKDFWKEKEFSQILLEILMNE